MGAQATYLRRVGRSRGSPQREAMRGFSRLRNWTAGGNSNAGCDHGGFGWGDRVAGPAFALDKVTFGTNWVADPEAGGYYQALVDGTYAKYGLDVTILQGGPTANGGMLLIAGKIEFYHGRRHDRRFPVGAEQHSHHRRRRAFPEESANLHVASWRRPRQMGRSAQRPSRVRQRGAVNTFWAWMRLAYGFKDENIKPYNFNSAPFIVEQDIRSSRGI